MGSDRQKFSTHQSLVRLVIGAVVAGTVTALVAALSVTAASAVPQPRPSIVGGTRASTEQTPWVVALTTSWDRRLCGGALVGPTKVVTAAHCLMDPGTGEPRAPQDLQAIVGRNDLYSKRGKVVQVERVWVHPQYRDLSQGYDVAVITLRKAVLRQPLPMVGAGETEPYRPGTPGRVYGWGRTSELLSLSSGLRSVEVPVSPDSVCHAAYQGYDSNAMFCAGTPEGGRDACIGDSGGPFVVDGRLVGIVSYGIGCGRPDAPGVYTRLSSYAEEINAQL